MKVKRLVYIVKKVQVPNKRKTRGVPEVIKTWSGKIT